MILKHVAAALRRQEWIAVAIEFTLVVTGVLLAFQISEWASERRTRGERQAAVSRLLLEAEESVAYLRASAAKQNQLIVDLDYALGQVERGSWRSGDQPRMTRALLRILNAAPAAPPSSVYDDLIASGTFGNIGDTRLRAAIANYRATLAFDAKSVDYVRQRMPEFERYAAFHYAFAPSERLRGRLEVDFPALERDSDLREALVLTTGRQIQLLQIRKRAAKDAENMCLELGRFAGRSCNLNRQPRNFD